LLLPQADAGNAADIVLRNLAILGELLWPPWTNIAIQRQPYRSSDKYRGPDMQEYVACYQIDIYLDRGHDCLRFSEPRVRSASKVVPERIGVIGINQETRFLDQLQPV